MSAPSPELTTKARKVIAKLTPPQRELMLTYGLRTTYGANRQMANALVKKELAVLNEDGPSWHIVWTDLGREVTRLLHLGVV